MVGFGQMARHSLSHSLTFRRASLHAFGRYANSSASSDSQNGIASQVEMITNELATQGSLLNQLTSAVGSHDSAITNLAGGLFGSFSLGNIAQQSSSGFSWSSILKDVFPVAGLVSGIVGLFDSTPAPPPLLQYDAPPSLNFDTVLRSDGTLAQARYNAAGHEEAAASGIDLTDAEGGFQPAYTRSSTGALVSTEGDSTGRYGGVLNLFSHSSQAGSTPAEEQTPGLLSSSSDLSALVHSVAEMPNSGGTNTSSLPFSEGFSEKPAVAPPPPAPVLPTANRVEEVPSFDQQWFMDHSSQIATAVRSALLDFHPLVDVVRDL